MSADFDPHRIICGLILPADFSTAALLGMVCVGMLFIGGVPWHMARAGIGVLGSLYGIGKAVAGAAAFRNVGRAFGTFKRRGGR